MATTAKASVVLTADQKAMRTRRREEILLRIHGSGDLKGDKDAEAALMTEIENFEWADGDMGIRAKRMGLIISTMASGATHMSDVVASVKKSIAATTTF